MSAIKELEQEKNKIINELRKENERLQGLRTGELDEQWKEMNDKQDILVRGWSLKLKELQELNKELLGELIAVEAYLKSGGEKHLSIKAISAAIKKAEEMK